MRGWCSLKSIISLIKYNNNNEMDRETATWCVTVAVRDAVVGRVVVECAVVGRTVVGRDAGNLYPNSGFYREKVEIPSHAVRKSLPKQRKSREKV